MAHQISVESVSEKEVSTESPAPCSTFGIVPDEFEGFQDQAFEVLALNLCRAFFFDCLTIGYFYLPKDWSYTVRFAWLAICLFSHTYYLLVTTEIVTRFSICCFYLAKSRERFWLRRFLGLLFPWTIFLGCTLFMFISTAYLEYDLASTAVTGLRQHNSLVTPAIAGLNSRLRDSLLSGYYSTTVSCSDNSCQPFRLVWRAVP